MMEQRKIPDLYVEMAASGELDDRRRREIEAEFGTEELSRRVEELLVSNVQILDRYPADSMSRIITERAREADGSLLSERLSARQTGVSRSLSRRLHELGGRIISGGTAVRWTATAAAAGLVLLLGVYLVSIAEHVGPGDSNVRAKGFHPTVLVYRHAGNSVELLQQGDIVKAKDTLQISYVAAGQKYGVILSVDGRGAVTVHLPESSARAAQLDQNGQVPLGFAYQLDNAPRFERFFFITSDEQFPVSEAVRSAERLASTPAAATAPLVLPKGLEQRSLLLKKAGY